MRAIREKSLPYGTWRFCPGGFCVGAWAGGVARMSDFAVVGSALCGVPDMSAVVWNETVREHDWAWRAGSAQRPIPTASTESAQAHKEQIGRATRMLTHPGSVECRCEASLGRAHVGPFFDERECIDRHVLFDLTGTIRPDDAQLINLAP